MFTRPPEIKLEAKKIVDPEVDFLSSTSEAQSASYNAVIERDLEVEVGCIWRPYEIVPLRYLKILLTAVQWPSSGLDINWQTLLTT